MAWLITSPTSTYAEEQLHRQLSALSTLPVNFSSSSTFVSNRKPSPTLENALHVLGGSTPAKRDELVAVLRALAQEGGSGTRGLSPDDANGAIEAEVIGRAVTMVWKEVIQSLIESALELEEERSWWDANSNSRRQVATYLLQSKLSCIQPDCELIHQVYP
jgi:nuclear-control-of-ATPase protein 2